MNGRACCWVCHLCHRRQRAAGRVPVIRWKPGLLRLAEPQIGIDGLEPPQPRSKPRRVNPAGLFRSSNLSSRSNSKIDRFLVGHTNQAQRSPRATQACRLGLWDRLHRHGGLFPTALRFRPPPSEQGGRAPFAPDRQNTKSLSDQRLAQDWKDRATAAQDPRDNRFVWLTTCRLPQHRRQNPGAATACIACNSHAIRPLRKPVRHKPDGPAVRETAQIPPRNHRAALPA